MTVFTWKCSNKYVKMYPILSFFNALFSVLWTVKESVRRSHGGSLGRRSPRTRINEMKSGRILWMNRVVHTRATRTYRQRLGRRFSCILNGKTSQGAIRAMGKEVLDTLKVPNRVPNRCRVDTPLTLIIISFTLISVRSNSIKSSTSANDFLDVTYLGNSTAFNLSVENMNIDNFELTRTRNYNQFQFESGK